MHREEGEKEKTSDESKLATIRIAVEALIRFKRVFHRDLTPSVLAELYVALELGPREIWSRV
jgi:hypothetical protein